MSVTPAMPAAYRRLTTPVAVGAPTASGILTPPLALSVLAKVAGPIQFRLAPWAMLSMPVSYIIVPRHQPPLRTSRDCQNLVMP